MSAEAAQENPQVVLGMFLVDSVPASVLFDSGASHSFISAQFVAKHSISMQPMMQPMIVKSPGGEMKALNLCPKVNLKILGKLCFEAESTISVYRAFEKSFSTTHPI